MVPPSLSGKEFEKALMDSASRLEKKGLLTMGRYGVQCVTFKKPSKHGGDPESHTMAVPSLPDFEGVLANGRQFIIEAKAVAGASFELRDSHFRDRQYSHLAKRARFGVLCFLVLHFGQRDLRSGRQPGMTVAVPVSEDIPFWRSYAAGAVRTLTRDDAQRIGGLVPWRVPERCRNALPDLCAFLGTAPALNADTLAGLLDPVAYLPPRPTLALEMEFG